MTKLNDDAYNFGANLGYFQPSYNLTVELVGSINEKRDIPIVLESISMQDDYEGDYTTRRVLLYTLRFTIKHSTRILCYEGYHQDRKDQLHLWRFQKHNSRYYLQCYSKSNQGLHWRSRNNDYRRHYHINKSIRCC